MYILFLTLSAIINIRVTRFIYFLIQFRIKDPSVSVTVLTMTRLEFIPLDREINVQKLQTSATNLQGFS